ncbi:MAG: hypothetical protein ACKO9F_10010, partial [Caldilinea sp.]
MGVIGGTRGFTLGTRKGCPYRIARPVGHRCHPGHPPVGATLAVALVVGHGVGHGCHRGHPWFHPGHPQGVPLQDC